MSFERKMSVFLLWWGAVFFLLTVVTSQSHVCPPRKLVQPCECTAKYNGLKIECALTDLEHISKAMEVLKGSPRSKRIFDLKLRHNSLPKLQGSIFSGLEINQLTIYNGSIGIVEESSLVSIGKDLTELDLSVNNLQTVPSNALKSLQRVRLLSLSHNNISTLHKNAFEGMDALEILLIRENKITSIDPGAFKGLEKKLKRLSLEGNDLTSVPTLAFSNMGHLKELDLEKNKISEISEEDFKGLTSLDELVLAHNRIRKVNENTFRHLRLLTTLQLEGNQITHLDPEAFVGLEENLQDLLLGNNNLNAIPSDALKGLHRLSILDLRANKISYITEYDMTGYGDPIKNLYLQDNTIQTLSTSAFDALNSLQMLNLQNNKITHLPEETMQLVLDTLTYVDISGNPLICDCGLSWYKEWLKKVNDKILSRRRIVCMMASEQQEYNLLESLDKMNCVDNSMTDNSMSKLLSTMIISAVAVVPPVCHILFV